MHTQQQHPSVGSALNIEDLSSSAQDIQSSLGSATSARDLQERRIIMAELQAARQAAARAEKAHRELEKAQRERENTHMEREQKVQREREEMRAELKEIKAAMKRLTRKEAGFQGRDTVAQ